MKKLIAFVSRLAPRVDAQACGEYQCRLSNCQYTGSSYCPYVCVQTCCVTCTNYCSTSSVCTG
ncbi:hypothetical protein J5X84_21385 [Streptosporangiaceae bacterium NEAU-GS5]|nr:hypothetical protein [Streptosporangiaceae bacterium NEAU-GS5]